MNRRTLFTNAAAIVAGAVSSRFVWVGTLFGLKQPARSEPPEPIKTVQFRPGMHLKITGKTGPGAWARHTGSWDKSSVTELETGAHVSNIQSLDLHIGANGWLVAVVTVVEREHDGRPAIEWVQNERGSWSTRTKRTRHLVNLDLDVTTLSETWAQQEEHLKQMEHVLRVADELAAHVEHPWASQHAADLRRASLAAYREARSALTARV